MNYYIDDYLLHLTESDAFGGKKVIKEIIREADQTSVSNPPANPSATPPQTADKPQQPEKAKITILEEKYNYLLNKGVRGRQFPHLLLIRNDNRYDGVYIERTDEIQPFMKHPVISFNEYPQSINGIINILRKSENENKFYFQYGQNAEKILTFLLRNGWALDKNPAHHNWLYADGSIQKTLGKNWGSEVMTSVSSALGTQGNLSWVGTGNKS
jgi:hypothetical protein